MRRIYLTSGGATLLALLVSVGLHGSGALAGEPPQPPADEDRVGETPLVIEVAKGEQTAEAVRESEPESEEDKVCSSGCGDGAKKYVPPLAREDFQTLLMAFNQEPRNPPGKALETLLFHHRDARAYLQEDWLTFLEPERRAFLERELSRTHAWIAFRVVDDEGKVRIHVAPTRVPLTEKQHLLPTATDDVQPAEFNGTVVRVGRDHLWVRY